MGTVELANGEKCPFGNCDFILGEDYDGDSFRHIMDKHGDDAIEQLFPKKVISLYSAIEIMDLVLAHHQIDGENMILRATAVGPIKDVRDFLVNIHNKDAIKRHDMTLLNETPEPPQGEEHEEEE